MPADPLTPNQPRPAVFLDRDDTLNVNAGLPDGAFPATRGDLFRTEYVQLLPGVTDACARLSDAGFALVVFTNQACVARGSAAIRDVEATNDRLRELLTVEGRCLIDAVYAAPHHPEAEVAHLRSAHPWRKPGPGMLLAAARELNLDLARSWLVGDAQRDLEAGIAAGLLRERCLRVGPDAAYTGLPDASDYIISSHSSRTGFQPVSPASPPSPSPPSATPVSTITLRAADGSPLADEDTSRNVESAAHAIAERTGVRLIDLNLDDRSVTATLATHRLAALGFMAELRRSTNGWHAHRNNGRTLWPQTGTPDD